MIGRVEVPHVTSHAGRSGHRPASPPPRRRRATAPLVLAAVLAAVPAGCGADPPPAEPGADDPVVVAAGDIACATRDPDYNGGEGTETRCRHKHTSELILDADHVLVLGDAQYPIGGLAQYRASYDPTWGRKKAVTYPTVGDHDYQSGSPEGYLTYWEVPEYYSFDIGSWHWVSLNSEIDHTADSAQLRWLREDLAATDQPCIGAILGVATFSSGEKGDDPTTRPFWEALRDVGADLVLSGDTHNYERFAKLDPSGAADPDGIRQFVVGTGGKSLHGFAAPRPGSEARGKVFGVLELRLGASSYAWEFRTESGGEFSDSGSAACNGDG